MAETYPAVNGTGLVTTAAAQTITGAKTFMAGSATTVPVTIQAAVGQSANITEWKNAAGTTVSSVDFAGQIHSLGLYAEANVAGQRPLTVKGFAGQTANLTEWQDSTGSVVARIRSTGTAELNYGLYTQGPVNGSPVSGHIQIDNTAANGTVDSKGLLIRARSGQTANLTEWLDNTGAIQAGVDPIGRYFVQTSAPLTAAGWGASISATPYHTSAPGIIVKGRASQTGNLTEWQDSAGTALFSILSDGKPYVNGLPIRISNVNNVPATIAGNGFLYVTNGALTYKGGNGTITTVAVS
jgi:hypothetical protein